MRSNRQAVKLGLLLMLLLLGGVSLLGVFVMGRGAPPSSYVVETVSGGAAAIPWVMITMITVLLLAVAFGVVTVIRAVNMGGKRKRNAEAGEYLDEFLEQDAIQLTDDGELPELDEDDVYLEEKPKRSEEE
jgi:hypothetical protein